MADLQRDSPDRHADGRVHGHRANAGLVVAMLRAARRDEGRSGSATPRFTAPAMALWRRSLPRRRRPHRRCAAPCWEHLSGFLTSLPCGACSDGAACEEGTCEEVDPVLAFCARVLQDRAGLTEGMWSGPASTCAPGSMSLEWQERALRSTNLYRWLAGQPPLALDADANPGLQDCSVMMHAAGALSHNPSPEWPCYTQAGAAGAGSSNLAGTPAVSAVDLYMVDPGNSTTIGHHRRSDRGWPADAGGDDGSGGQLRLGRRAEDHARGLEDADWRRLPGHDHRRVQAHSVQLRDGGLLEAPVSSAPPCASVRALFVG